MVVVGVAFGDTAAVVVVGIAPVVRIVAARIAGARMLLGHNTTAEHGVWVAGELVGLLVEVVCFWARAWGFSDW